MRKMKKVPYAGFQLYVTEKLNTVVKDMGEDASDLVKHVLADHGQKHGEMKQPLVIRCGLKTSPPQRFVIAISPEKRFVGAAMSDEPIGGSGMTGDEVAARDGVSWVDTVTPVDEERAVLNDTPESRERGKQIVNKVREDCEKRTTTVH
jgi:hypothetical protein